MIYVIGSNGQVGLSLQKLGAAPLLCDLCDISSIEKELHNIKSGSVIINAAAYTAVDKAEDDSSNAFAVNADGVFNLAEVCKKYSLKLIHISTDYVFDGNTFEAYTEDSKTKPIGIYGMSKLAGEENLQINFDDFIIIRTSWVYSEYRTNFLKTMISLKSREAVSVVVDQIGTPTYAGDLAQVILMLAQNFDEHIGELYHYSNEGVCSWYDFAVEIFEILDTNTLVKPILSSEFPSKVRRPKISLLNKNKIKSNLNIQIPHWKESLKICLKNLS